MDFGKVTQSLTCYVVITCLFEHFNGWSVRFSERPNAINYLPELTSCFRSHKVYLLGLKLSSGRVWSNISASGDSCMGAKGVESRVCIRAHGTDDRGRKFGSEIIKINEKKISFG